VSWVNYDDALLQLQRAGLEVAHLEVDTPRPVRCREKDGDREKRGWYWLHGVALEYPKGSGVSRDFIVGSFGVFHGNDNGKQKIRLSGMGAAVSAQTLAAIKARHADSVRRAAAIRAAEQEKAAFRAGRCWAAYLPIPADGAMPDYLRRKGVRAHGLRYSPAGNGTIAIPMCDAAGKVWGLQIIRSSSQKGKLEKQYWPAGMLKTGHYHLLGSPGTVVLLAEGYATAATLHEATGLCTAVAFDASDLLPVAQALHKTWPSVHVLVCADDDYLTAGNPGVAAARNAALAVGGSVVVPVFPVDRAGKAWTDFNDLALAPDGGLHVVRAQVDAALARAKLAATPGAADAHLGGGGERRAEAVMPLDDLVARFVPVDDGTGEFVFDHWTCKIARKTQMMALLPAGVRGDDIKKHPLWANRAAWSWRFPRPGRA